MKNNKLLFLILLLLVTAGCSKDEVKGDPDKPFVGRWQEIARGNTMYPELPPSGSILEFFEDETCTYYVTPDPTYYRTDAEFLYLYLDNIPDGHTFRYTFSGLNILRLDYVDGMIEDSGGTPTFRIYQRLK